MRNSKAIIDEVFYGDNWREVLWSQQTSWFMTTKVVAFYGDKWWKILWW